MVLHEIKSFFAGKEAINTEVLQSTKSRIIYHRTQLYTLGMHYKGSKSACHGDISHQPRYLTTGECMQKKMFSTRNGDFFSHEGQDHAIIGSQVNLEIIHEMSQAQKGKYHIYFQL